MNIVARTYMGGKDLYFELPDLKGSKIIDTKYEKTFGDYETTLIIEDINGIIHKLVIVQEIE